MRSVHVQRQTDDAPGVWSDLPGGLKVVEAKEGSHTRLAYLPHGMVSGAPSIMLGFELEGRFVSVQMSASQFLTIAAGVQGWAEKDGLVGYAPIRDFKDGADVTVRTR